MVSAPANVARPLMVVSITKPHFTFCMSLHNSRVLRVIAGFMIAALVLTACGWFVTGPYREYAVVFDSSIRGALRQMQSPMWTALFLAVTKLGSTWYTVIIGSAAGIIFLFLRWLRPLVLFIIVMAGQAALHHGAKWLFARPRPSALISYAPVESFSFPSGHAITAVCLYGSIAWIVAASVENSAAKAGIAIFSILLIFLVGMSRVYIGVHHSTDVLSGFLAALIWTAAVMSVDRDRLVPNS